MTCSGLAPNKPPLDCRGSSGEMARRRVGAGGPRPASQTDTLGVSPVHILPEGTITVQGERRVHFAADTVDNEQLCRQRSNACCIFRHDHADCDPERNNYERQ